MDQKKVISVKDLSFVYPGSDAKSVDDQSFDINMGEFVLLCGSSGSGSSSLCTGCVIWFTSASLPASSA